MDLKPYWADSRGKVIVVLLVLWIVSLANHFQINLVLNVLLAVFASSILNPSLSSIVTGLLIGLIFDPMAGVLPVLVACILARIGKHKHIFNPAAFGIMFSSLIFNRPVAWWGAAWGMLPVAIIAVGMLPILWRLRRQWMPLTFFIIYMAATSLRLTIDGTVFLFAFVMLPEPKTSPVQGKWSLGWGILVGFLVLAQSFFGITLADPLLLALLVANTIGFIVKR